MSRISKICTSILLASTSLTIAYAQPADTPPAEEGEIIVTGTRATGMQAAMSAAPVQLLSADSLAKVGQPNLNQALTQLVPSFQAQTQGTDMSNFSLSARLRGLSPNHTLVMVNGKRRHNSAILQVIAGPFQGSAAPSIDLIPPDAVQRIEILQDGAAAQYGSDAIAGVINIILKNNTSGGSAKATAGQYYDGEGTLYSASTNFALPVGEAGFVDVTLFHRRQDYTYVGDGQIAVTNANGQIYSGLTGPAANWSSLNLKNINGGQAKSDLSIGFINAGYDLGGVELYAFGDFATRIGYAKQGYRHPARICATTGNTIGAAGGSGTYIPANCFADTGTVGMVPEQRVDEDEFSITGGIKGDAGGFHWDLSTTYGEVTDNISTVKSANRLLYINTGQTPRDFYDGAFKFTQLTMNADFRKEFEIGFAEPLTVAFGGEYRKETYTIRAGEPLSYYGDGAQSFPGYSPQDAGHHGRNAKAGYIDFILKPVEQWSIDLAGRYEHFSDFGDTTIGKLTTRYDFSDAFALRGTVSTGFRAPTLQESFYSAINVGPTSVSGQLPPNSAAAASLGFSPLRPEKSKNLSLGVVLRPIPRLVVTIDGYYIKIKDRIVGTAPIRGLVSGVQQTTPTINGLTAYQAVLNALRAQGVFTGDLPNLSAQTFTNGVDTRTIGIDFAARYPVDLPFGKLDLSLTANFNDTEVVANRVPFNLFSAQAISYLETAQPAYKVLLGGLFTSGRFSANLRQSYQDASKVIVTSSVTGFGPYVGVVKATFLTDLEFGYDLTDWINISVGANNLFDKKPEIPNLLPAGATVNPGVSPYENGSGTIKAPYGHGTYGTNGGFYYARLSFKF
ncbi:MAG: TonB-dependent receptor [Sphingobium sp.]